MGALVQMIGAEFHYPVLILILMLLVFAFQAQLLLNWIPTPPQK
jgi:hypothetical protein